MKGNQAVLLAQVLTLLVSEKSSDWPGARQVLILGPIKRYCEKGWQLPFELHAKEGGEAPSPGKKGEEVLNGQNNTGSLQPTLW